MSHEPFRDVDHGFLEVWFTDAATVYPEVSRTGLLALATIDTLTAERDAEKSAFMSLMDASKKQLTERDEKYAELVQERDALGTTLEEVQLRARIMSVPDADCGEEVLRDVFLHIADRAREALGGKS